MVLEYAKITYWRSVGKEVSSDKVRWEEGIHKWREKEEEKKEEREKRGREREWGKEEKREEVSKSTFKSGKGTTNRIFKIS